MSLRTLTWITAGAWLMLGYGAAVHFIHEQMGLLIRPVLWWPLWSTEPQLVILLRAMMMDFIDFTATWALSIGIIVVIPTTAALVVTYSLNKRERGGPFDT